MMTTKVVPLLVLIMVSSAVFSAAAEVSDRSKFEAAIASEKSAVEKAMAAHDAAKKTVADKRQQSVRAKKKADDLRASQQKQAEKQVAVAAKAVTAATNTKTSKDKALTSANTVVAKAQQDCSALEKAVQDAEAVAKKKAETVSRLASGADKATATAAAKLKRVVDASAALTKAQKEEEAALAKAAETAQKHNESIAHKKLVDQVLTNVEKQQDEQHAKALAATAAQKLKETDALKKSADAALANARKQVAAAIRENQAAKTAANDIIRLEQENQQAAAQVVAKRKASDVAKAVLVQAKKKQEEAKKQVVAAEQKMSQSIELKKSAEQALAKIKGQVAAEMETHKAAEKAAKEAEGKVAKAKVAVDKAQAALIAAKKASVDLLPPIERAEAKHEEAEKVAKEAGAAIAPLRTAMQKADKAYAEVKKVADAKRQTAIATKKLSGQSGVEDLKRAEEAVPTSVKALDTATKAKPPLDKALVEARDAARPLQEAFDKADKEARKAKAAAKIAYDAAYKHAIEAKKTAVRAAAKRRAVSTGKPADITALRAEAEKYEKIAKEKKKAAAEADKKRKELGSALFKLAEASKQAAAKDAAKRSLSNKAWAALNPKAKILERALTNASNAKQNVERAEKQKKATQDALEKLKKRIESAKKTHKADEKAAVEAEAKAAPLKAEAEKTRAAYAKANNVASKKRGLAQQAKATLYQLVAAGQVASLMDSPASPKPGNKIDELVFKKLKSLGIQPVLCSDAVFVRRAFLDLTGGLPTAAEAKTFILDKDQKKRTALIDRLLEQTSHYDYWAMKWSDIFRIKAEFPVKVWPNGAQVYHRWVWESIAQNKPYDKFVRELLTSSGSNFRVGAVNFYRAIQDKTPEGIATSVGLAFMGTRLFHWPEDRRANMAVFFSQVGYKPTSEWKEDIVFWDPLGATKIPGCIAPGNKAVAEAVKISNKIPKELEKPLDPNGPLAAVFPDGTKTTISPSRDPREVFADWLIRPENPWFARAIVNRTWVWAMGRGIVHEPDDIRKDNPPSNPQLLDYLEKELVSSGYDMKHLKRLIFGSTTYQFSSIPRFKTPEAKANFASYPLRRVEAEVLIDAVNQVTGSSDLYTSAVPEPFTYIPKHMSAVELADGSVTSSFLMLFGRSARATGMENERVSELASRQWLHMLNSATIQNKLQAGQKLPGLFSKGGKPEEIAERLYLTILSRFPTEADVKAAEEYINSGVSKGQNAWFDLSWALINNPEFLLRH